MQSKMIQETINLLGKRGRDKITGVEGVVECVTFDLYGCVQIILRQKVKEDGKIPASGWLDVQRIVVQDDERVMNVPDFNAVAVKPAEYPNGPAEKPIR